MSRPLNEIVDAVNAARKQAEAIIALGEYVRDIASVEQASLEASQRLAAKQEQESAQNEKLRALSDAISMAESDVARNKAEAAAILNKGRTDAGVALRDAEREANRIIAEAKAEAERLKGPLNADIALLAGKVATAKADLAGVMTAQAEAKAELDATNDRLAKARKAISDMLKG